MESGLAESQAASGVVKIGAGLPLPAGVAHNGLVISNKWMGAFPSASSEDLPPQTRGLFRWNQMQGFNGARRTVPLRVGLAAESL